jgi:hypothetical protein
MIIPAGGLSADGMEWIKANRQFFLPVKVLSKVFRGVMWSLLEKELGKGSIRLPKELSLATLKKKLYEKNWNVYTKKSLAGPQSVVQYLGKYTHRVAISNNRIVAMEEGKVTFRWKDYRLGQQNRLLTLHAEEFIGRFMRHVLPTGFYKIRYFGLLAASNGDKKQRCVNLLHQTPSVALLQGISVLKVLYIVTGIDPEQCTRCKKGKMILHATFLPPG